MNQKHKAAALSLALAMVTGLSACDSKQEDASVSYHWGNVAIGGGGYVTGITYNPTEEGLMYARTDMGGAYRWKSGDNQWVCITDHLGGVNSDSWNLNGVESLATDPVEPNRVYMSCGTYMGQPGAILCSDDYGNNWKQVDIGVTFGANNSGRGAGERMMVDPKHNSTVYLGTRSDGLWRSKDYGANWEQVSSFPVKGNYSQEGISMGILWVEFDPVSGDIYVCAAMKDGQCIYTSSDQGESWEALPANEKGMYPTQAGISSNGYLYLSYSDTCGPNTSCKNGKVYRWSLADKKYEDITPQVGDNHYGGYGGVSIDAKDPDTVVVSSLCFWDGKGENLYRTTDGGKTWKALYDESGSHYRMDVTDAQWLNWGREQPQTGWWVSDIEINPFNSDEVTYGTGATVYTTVNMTALDNGGDVTIKFNAYGLEENAVFKMVSPPHADGSTPQLYSIMGDLTGFSHMDVNVRPDDAHFMKEGVPQDVDCAWLNPNVAAYTSDNGKMPVRITLDGGKTWNACTALGTGGTSGTVALSANGSTMLWAPNSTKAETYVSNDNGKTWYVANGLGFQPKMAADKVNPSKIYAACGGQVFASEDGGFNFAPTGALVSDTTTLYTVDGREGHVWALSGSIIMFSQDGGKTFENLKNFNARAMGFGAPKNAGDYPVLYAMGSSDNVNGIFRSADQGKTWQRINDDKHQFGNITPYICGDGSVYGKVYFATNGRGIVMGDIAE